MNLYTILAPLFMLILSGYLLNRRSILPPEPFVSSVMNFFMPCLIFSSLIKRSFEFQQFFITGFAALIIILILYSLTLVFCRLAGIHYRKIILPVIFMNSGFLGIPLIDLLYGTQALTTVICFDQVQTFIILTLGITIAKNKPPLTSESYPPTHWLMGVLKSIIYGIKTLCQEPIFYAMILPFIIKLLHWALWPVIINSIEYSGRLAPGLALFALGLKLAEIKLIPDKIVLTSVCLRYVTGFIAGIITVTLFGFAQPISATIFIASTLPSAVFSYIIAERYDCYPDIASSTVLITTILALIVLPFIVMVANLL